jgi:hypothetical protein
MCGRLEYSRSREQLGGRASEFRRGLQSRTWDELQLAYYCGYLIWNYMVTPFILAESDFETKELRRRGVRGERLRRLEVTFPARVVTHGATQTFHFEREGLLRRLDYGAAHENSTQVAQMFSGHQRFAGILVPTLCRLLRTGADGVPVTKPTLLDLDIFDKPSAGTARLASPAGPERPSRKS